MNMKRFAALSLALAMAVVTLVGCTVGAETRVAATYTGGEVPAGIYIAYQYSALNEAIGQVEDPYATNILDQKIGEVKVSDWVNNRAQELVRSHVAIESEFARLGLTLDPAVAGSVVQTTKQSWETEKTWMEKAGISYPSLEAVSLATAKSDVLFTAYYVDSGERGVSESDYESFYRENYRLALMAVLSKNYDSVTQAAFTEEAKAAQLTRINDYFARAKAGEKTFDLLVEETTRIEKEAFLTYSDSGEEDFVPRELEEKSQLSLIYRENTSYPADVLEAVFATESSNTPETFENEEFGIVFELRDLMEDPTFYESAKPQMLSQMKGQEYLDGLKTTGDALGVTFNQSALKVFSPTKLLG